MKHYFQFTLTGKKFFPIWIAFLIFYVVPQVLIQTKIQSIQPTDNPDEAVLQFYALLKYYSLTIPLTLVQFSALFVMVRLILNNIVYNNTALNFSGEFKNFLKLVFVNFLLTIVTFGVYSPWFTTKIYKFFASNTKYHGEEFSFEGKGGDLLLIYIFCFLIPVSIFLFFLAIVLIAGHISGNPNSLLIAKIISGTVPVISLIMIPFVYYSLKWQVNYKFKDKHIHWETGFWKSILFLALQTALTLVTFWIYFPLALIQTYRFFMHKTVVESNDQVRHFGYDMEMRKDFFFLLGQMVLTSLSLGIYLPWSMTKIAARLLEKTYLEQEMLPEETLAETFSVISEPIKLILDKNTYKL